MPRLARIAPGLPHHVTQRGNRRQATFFHDSDYLLYVHLIVVPDAASGLSDCLRETHRRYTRQIDLREGWRGYLWQGRFASSVLDQAHLLAAARYVERNPVRAGLYAAAQEWPWSSARSHIDDGADGLTVRRPLLDLVADWAAFVAADDDEPAYQRLRAGSRSGRPQGDDALNRPARGHARPPPPPPEARPKPGFKHRAAPRGRGDRYVSP